jgi:SAM-dependent methyltransferase
MERAWKIDGLGFTASLTTLAFSNPRLHYHDSVPATQKVIPTVRQWWKEYSAHNGLGTTLPRILAIFAEFLSDSTPSRKKQRYGDVDYDWDHRVDTTAATLSWRSRLIGLFHSSYQPTEPTLFREMLGGMDVDFRKFTFIDIGSGKGRALLMAADFPFHGVLGVELLPELHRIAQANINRYASPSQQCFSVQSVCADAREFAFPPQALLLYLFNPLPEPGLRRLLENLQQSLRENPRPMYLLYHNPLLEHVLAANSMLQKVHGTHQFSLYRENPPHPSHP